MTFSFTTKTTLISMQGTFPVSLDQSKTASLSEEVITFVKIRKEDNLFAFELSSVRRSQALWGLFRLSQFSLASKSTPALKMSFMNFKRLFFEIKVIFILLLLYLRLRSNSFCKSTSWPLNKVCILVFSFAMTKATRAKMFSNAKLRLKMIIESPSLLLTNKRGN